MISKKTISKLVEKYEKEYMYKSKKIKYLHIPCNSKEKKGLLISFGGWSNKYVRIRGYYENLKAKYDLLYLKDEFGFRNKGAFYLAENGDFSVEKAYTLLIKKIIKDSKNSKNMIICLGSSMGGFASIYFGFKINAKYIISLCPIFKIKKMYSKHKKHKNLYKEIIGKSKKDIDKYILNNLNKKTKSNIYIFYEKNDSLTINSGLSEVIKSFIDNKNIFKLESKEIKIKRRNPHLAISRFMDHNKLINIFDKNLQ